MTCPPEPRSISRPIRAAAVAAVSLAGLYAGSPDRARDIGIVATQVRRLGYACTNPSAAQVVDAGTPGQKVYELKCDGVTYRVRLIPHLAAQVTEIKWATPTMETQGRPGQPRMAAIRANTAAACAPCSRTSWQQATSNGAPWSAKLLKRFAPWFWV